MRPQRGEIGVAPQNPAVSADLRFLQTSRFQRRLDCSCFHKLKVQDGANGRPTDFHRFRSTSCYHIASSLLAVAGVQTVNPLNVIPSLRLVWRSRARQAPIAIEEGPLCIGSTDLRLHWPVLPFS